MKSVGEKNKTLRNNNNMGFVEMSYEFCESIRIYCIVSLNRIFEETTINNVTIVHDDDDDDDDWKFKCATNQIFVLCIVRGRGTTK